MDEGNLLLVGGDAFEVLHDSLTVDADVVNVDHGCGDFHGVACACCFHGNLPSLACARPVPRRIGAITAVSRTGVSRNGSADYEVSRERPSPSVLVNPAKHRLKTGRDHKSAGRALKHQIGANRPSSAPPAESNSSGAALAPAGAAHVQLRWAPTN